MQRYTLVRFKHFVKFQMAICNTGSLMRMNLHGFWTHFILLFIRQYIDGCCCFGRGYFLFLYCFFFLLCFSLLLPLQVLPFSVVIASLQLLLLMFTDDGQPQYKLTAYYNHLVYRKKLALGRPYTYKNVNMVKLRFGVTLKSSIKL